MKSNRGNKSINNFSGGCGTRTHIGVTLDGLANRSNDHYGNPPMDHAGFEPAWERPTPRQARSPLVLSGKEVCPERFVLRDPDSSDCFLCGAASRYYAPRLVHGIPRFLESLDAMQLIVESGKFALVREEYCDWRGPEVKPSMAQYECTIFLYRTGKGPQDNIFFKETGNSRQEAFYTAALSVMGYDVIKKEQQ